jgi:hypothetical protein
VLAALSTGHKIGLGLSALAFIAYALISAMVIPRTHPDFPGRRLGVYVVVTVLFFIGMMAAVFVFGKEEPEPEQHESALALRLYKERRGRDLNPRHAFRRVRDFQSRSLDRSDTSPCDEHRSPRIAI